MQNLDTPMIYGIGLDMIEVSRIAKEISKEKSSFQKRLFTASEIDYCERKRHKAQHYAARFAAKEAFLKALGTGLRNGLSWKNIEILNDELGKPVVRLHGKAKELVDKNQIVNIFISLSHIKEMAVAVVILEK